MISKQKNSSFKMISVVLVLMLALDAARGECMRVSALGPCEYALRCEGPVRALTLPPECRASANMPVAVRLTLIDTAEPNLARADPALLHVVTDLHAPGSWLDTNLTTLELMPRLRHLTLPRNNIQQLPGSPFYYLSYLETIDLSHNQLSEVNEAFHFESSTSLLRNLSLAHNSLTFLPADAFDDLKMLAELDLSYNQISDLNEEPFRKLAALETLRLNDNKIKDLNGALNHLGNLKHLYIMGNDLEDVDIESLNLIYHLKTLDASGNQLQLLWPGVFLRHWQHFDGICRIRLARNHITYVPAAAPEELAKRFGKTRHSRDPAFARQIPVPDFSTEVDLSDNSITNVEFDSFQWLVQLVSLDLSSNKLINFAVDPEHLKFVRNLNLSSNYIAALEYDGFSSLVNLQRLDLSNNRLEHMPDKDFGTKLRLRYLSLASNSFLGEEAFQLISFSPEGGILDLSNTGLAAYDTASRDLNTNSLLLSDNNITDTSEINLIDQHYLRELDLSGNQVQALDDSSLNLPFYLLLLDFSDNEIENVSTGAFAKLGRLRTLRLGGNRLGEVGAGSFSGLSALINLDLSRNYLGYLDAAAVQDLKSLRVLSLRYNQIAELDDRPWLGHRYDLKVFVDGSGISCEWLSGALSNFNNGLTRMRPVAEGPAGDGFGSVEGIPCRAVALLRAREPRADPRLLFATQRILEALKEQNYYLRKLSRSETVNQTNLRDPI